jgi:predicted alpha/beta hydrolase family esterase
MKTAIILHGKPDPGQEEYYNADFPSASNSHWLPWLQKQLTIHDIAAQTPEMPNERYDINPDTLLVGHSCGAGFIVRWLSEHPDIRVGNVVLVAPSLGIDWDTSGFFNFTIDPNLASRTQKLMIFIADNDRDAIQQAAKILRETIADVQYREFRGYGHFCIDDMKTVEFPELRDELLSA